VRSRRSASTSSERLGVDRERPLRDPVPGAVVAYAFAGGDADALRTAIQRIRNQAEQAVREGKSELFLSDRDIGEDKVGIAGVLAAAADANLPLDLALRRASAAAGLACLAIGAQQAMPERAAIDAAVTLLQP